MPGEPIVWPDRVTLGKGQSTRDVTVDEFLLMPVHQRVELLLNQELAFFIGETRLPTLDTLKMIRRAHVNTA